MSKYTEVTIRKNIDQIDLPDITNILGDLISEEEWIEAKALLTQPEPVPEGDCYNEMLFCEACEVGNIQMAKWMFEADKNLDISFQNERAFRYAASHGHLDVAKWLLEIKPGIDISADDDYAYRNALLNTHSDVVEWLSSLK